MALTPVKEAAFSQLNLLKKVVPAFDIVIAAVQELEKEINTL